MEASFESLLLNLNDVLISVIPGSTLPGLDAGNCSTARPFARVKFAVRWSALIESATIRPSADRGQPLRVIVSSFQPNRSQRRVRKLNDGSISLRIGAP